ncbi:ABC transporter permease [Candidatus Cryosericum odellii]|uniref:ABC transporter permease n=2 Tax=Candidatus Cryosericum odellii TaxID=2290917 RepID=A0A398D6W9_9BACT|nr:ABC transporter permease [Candidatus Cryosericum odellii]RIE11286.1 ABC transporter permease [Candidatus Cryosericum odellii]
MWSAVFRRLRRNKMAMAGLVIIILVVLMAVLAKPLSMGNDPYRMLNVNEAPVEIGRPELMPPMPSHILGTDELARDAWSRLLYGARVSLFIGIVASFLCIVIGTIVGLISGYFGGWVDILAMRFTDMMLCIPSLVLMVILSAVLKGGVFQLILVIVTFGWMSSARLVRGQVLSLKEQEYVESARAIGASGWRIMFNHLLPNTMAPIIVSFSMSISGTIIHEASLSFLGLGIPQPIPSWGNMLTNSQNYMFSAPWLIWWPGLAIFVTVLGFNFLGDGLRDALDPRLKL